MDEAGAPMPVKLSVAEWCSRPMIGFLLVVLVDDGWWPRRAGGVSLIHSE